MTPRHAQGGFLPARSAAVPPGMLPDPPHESWLWQRAGYAARHFSGQIFYRIRLGAVGKRP